MNQIISSIRKSYPMSDASIDELTYKMTRLELPKKYILIKSGVVERNYFFIEKGLTRSYCLFNGNEVTSWFSKEGEVTFSMLGSYHKKQGFENVDLLEDSVIYSLPVDVLNLLYETNIEIANWSRLLHQNAFLELELRHIAMVSQSAKERYENFIREKPAIMQRVNLGYIASFLGMSQVSLSRLRAKHIF